MIDPRIELPRTVPYELLRNAVELRVRSEPAGGPPPRGFQFLLARHTGPRHEQEPDYLLASPFVALEGARERRTDSGYGAQFAHFYDRLFPADGGAEAAIDYLAGLHLAEARAAARARRRHGADRDRAGRARRRGRRRGLVGGDARASSSATPSAVAACSATCAASEDEGGHGIVYCVLGSLSIVLRATSSARCSPSARAPPRPARRS